MSKEETKQKRSSVSLPGETAEQLNVICRYRRSKKIFDCTQPKVLIDLINKEYKKVTKK